MRTFTLIIYLLISFAFSTSCSKDDANDLSVVGTWSLSTWTVKLPINLNNDAISSINLLDEAECDNSEILVFDANGTVSSDMTYNPEVTISLTDGSTDMYSVRVVCDTEGVVGTSGDYTQNNNSVTFFGTTAITNGNQLTVVYENAIEIYNEDLTTVVETKDLTLVYTKK